MTKLSTNSSLTEFLFFLIALLYFLPIASAKKNSVSATSSASWAFSSTALSFDYLLEVLPLLLLCVLLELLELHDLLPFTENCLDVFAHSISASLSQ